MFKKILLDCGNSADTQMLGNVIDFCRKTQGKLTAVNVFQPPSRSILDYFKSRKMDLEDLLLKNREEDFREALQKAGGSREEIDTVVRWGIEFIEIIKQAQKDGSDLVVTSARDSDKFPDSTAMHLLRKCPCPVWIHRGYLWKGAIRILAAVQADPSDEVKMELDRKVLRYATALSETLRGKLHIAHCWTGYLESVVSHRLFNEKEADEYLEHARKESEDAFKKLTGSVDLPQGVRTAMPHGDPGILIPGYVAEKRMDILVMGSVARTGIPGLFIGNTAEKIAASIDCSVLAIKPDGFESPVK